MDPLSALGVAAAFIQFIDFGTKVGKRMLLMYDKSKIDPHEYFERTTDDLDDYLKLLDNRQGLSRTTPGARTANEEAIAQLMADCRKVAQSLRDTFQGISRVSHKTNRVTMAITKTIGPSVIGAFKAVWKESEIEMMASVLESYRSQLILRTLLSLDSKANKGLENQQEMDKNISDIIEVLAVLQERQEESTTHQTQELVQRLERSDDLARSYHEETIAAILKFKDGDVQVLEHPSQPDMATSSAQHSTRQRLVKLNAGAMSSLAQASLDELGPVEELVLNSLYFRQMTDRIETVKTPHQKTYEWVFCDPLVTGKPWDDFSRWLSYGSGSYWICGKAGAGKSTLMKSVFHHPRTSLALREWAQGQHLVQASFFFSGFGSRVQKSQEGLLRSLLYDILKMEPQMIWVVMTELLPLATSLGPGEKLAEPSMAELMRWFKRLLQPGHGRRYFFLIDGLDEYDGDKSTIVDFVSSLSQQPNVKFLVSSRPIPVCVDNFSTLPKLYLHDLTRDDIRRYAEDWLSVKVRRKGGDPKVLIDHIVEKSSGVFVWVELSVKSVLRGLENRDNMAELQQRLDELPTDLAELYAHMLAGMSAAYRKQAAQLFRIVLRWMQYPTYPLLTLQMSFADEDPAQLLAAPVRQIAKADELSRCDMIDGRIRSRCCGLIETRRPTPSEAKVCASLRYEFPCVDFLHRTVVEFLSEADVLKDLFELGGGLSFNPSVTLFQTSAYVCKLLPKVKSIDADTSLVWRLMKDSLPQATFVEASSSPLPAVYIRDLDKTMSAHWQEAKKVSNHAHSRKAVDHWAASLALLGHDEECKFLRQLPYPLDFTSVAVAYSLASYLMDDLLSPSGTLAQSTAAKARALYDAIQSVVQNPWSSSSPIDHLRRPKSRTICELLLKHGADPNVSYRMADGSEGTAWSVLVQQTSRYGYSFSRDFGQRDTATTLGNLLISFVIGGADVNARIWCRREKGGPEGQELVEVHESPLTLLERVFPLRLPLPNRSAGLLSQDGTAVGSSPAGIRPFEQFRRELMRLLLERGALAQEWQNGRLVTAPSEEATGPIPSSGFLLSQFTPVYAPVDMQTRTRLRHKLRQFFRRHGIRPKSRRTRS